MYSGVLIVRPSRVQPARMSLLRFRSCFDLFAVQCHISAVEYAYAYILDIMRLIQTCGWSIDCIVAQTIQADDGMLNRCS